MLQLTLFLLGISACVFAWIMFHEPRTLWSGSLSQLSHIRLIGYESYHQIENADIILSKRTLSLHGLSEKAIAVQSPEDTLVETQEQQEQKEMRHLLMDGLDSCLTPAQHRRLWLYCVDGLSEEAIALAENVKQQSISECLRRAKEKIKKFLNLPL